MTSWIRGGLGYDKNLTNPQFFSSILDETYHSIDNNNDKSSDTRLKFMKQSNKGGVKTMGEDMANFRRACLIEKWIEKKVCKNVSAQRRSLLSERDNNSLYHDGPLFFGSNFSDTSCMDSHCCKIDSFCLVKTRITCFTDNKLKQIGSIGQTKSRILENYVMFHE